jgi:hypothetical protein
LRPLELVFRDASIGSVGFLKRRPALSSLIIAVSHLAFSQAVLDDHIEDGKVPQWVERMFVRHFAQLTKRLVGLGVVVQVGPSGPISARQEPSHYLQVRIAAAALELILLHSTLSEGCNLFFGPSPILRKLHPFADDLSARLVFFHFLSLGLNFLLFSHHIREFNVGFESFWILRLAKHYPYHDVDNVFILHIRQLENGLERPRGVLARSKTQTQVANGVTKQSLPNLKKFDCAPMISSVSVVA